MRQLLIQTVSKPCLLAFPLIVIALIAPNILGCRLTGDDVAGEGRSPLRPATPSRESVSLEIFWARYAWDDPELNHSVWNEIDESQIPVPTRRLLAENGFRAGVVGSIVPLPIARVLELQDNAERTDESDTQQEQELAQLLTEPAVTRRRRQLRPDTRLEVQASDPIGHLPLLLSEGGELGGHTYSDAQAVYALQVEPNSDRSVQLEIIPELHHGPPQLRYSTNGDGIMRQQPLRDREVFADLAMRVNLAPGELLVVTGISEATGRLGHYFHSLESTQGRQQKLIVIRLAQVPESQAFADTGSRWPW